jgi:hypothetical protein
MRDLHPLGRVLAALLLVGATTTAQNLDPLRPTLKAEKIRPGVYRVDKIEIDTNSKEMSVPATVNSKVTTLEFVANSPNGAKAYESALTVQADPLEFNTALLLLGADPAHARVPRFHFDTVAPDGDPLDLFLTWSENGATKRIRVEELLFDIRQNAPMPEGPWVYTGSSFTSGRFMASLDGVLIGFVHSPSPIIENPRSGAVNAYGSVVLNTHLALPDKPLTLTVKLLTRKAKSPK